jgi:hypothetical protein
MGGRRGVIVSLPPLVAGGLLFCLAFLKREGCEGHNFIYLFIYFCLVF